jgi:hypothetical protein
MSDRFRWITGAACALSLALVSFPASAQQDDTFMPKGGKTLLLEMLGSTPDKEAVQEITRVQRSETEWAEALAAKTKGLSEQERRTLAAYLAVNMPLPEGATADAVSSEGLAKALPRDGRELAWNECQFCHSLFTSHLTQERDVQAWRNMFQSPFHRELKMTRQEREEFSQYSAINMPMKIEDVPAALRF